MTFAEMLAAYIGSQIEVFQTNGFFTGELLETNPNYFVLETAGGTYPTPVQPVTIVNDSVQFVRILTA